MNHHTQLQEVLVKCGPNDTDLAVQRARGEGWQQVASREAGKSLMCSQKQEKGLYRVQKKLGIWGDSAPLSLNLGPTQKPTLPTSVGLLLLPCPALSSSSTRVRLTMPQFPLGLRREAGVSQWSTKPSLSGSGPPRCWLLQLSSPSLGPLLSILPLGPSLAVLSPQTRRAPCIQQLARLAHPPGEAEGGGLRMAWLSI